MATATVPAAVPDPNDPPNASTGSAPSGLLASMLAPVEPARTATFDIPAPATADSGLEAPVAGASSAAYHGNDEAGDASQKSSGTADKKSVLRALLLAAATRWAKGGGYQNKRLDLEKAKASRQAKEDRKVSINRTDSLPGKGSTGSGAGGDSGGGKGNSGGSGKGPAKGPVKGPKNSNGNAHQGPAEHSGGSAGPGRSGGTGRGHGGDGSTGGNGSDASPKSPKPNGTGSGSDSKPEKADLSKGRGSSGTDGDKAGTQGPSSSSGKNGGAGNGGSSGSTKGPGTGTSAGDGHGKSPDRGSGSGKVHTDTKAGKKNSGQDTTSGTGKSPSKDAPSKEHRGAKDGKQPGPSSKDSAAKPGKSGAADAATDKKNGAGSPDKTNKDTKDKGGQDGKDTQPQAKTDPKKADGKPFSVKESRQTGYRDGTRAAKAVAHAKAYRDGARDGYRDVTEAADRQKAHLDKAHQERKKTQDAARDKEKDVSGAGSSADHHQPQPIEVKGIDAKTLWLGEGAARNTISRSEVRSLKHFERRLEERLATLKDSVERTKLLKAHAEAQAQKAAALMEATKSVKGGDKLIASLVKTADDAKVQAGLADEINKRAVRAADGCAAVLANAKTRYGGMYKAVVDSDERVPGEMDFYKDGATTHG